MIAHPILPAQHHPTRARNFRKFRIEAINGFVTISSKKSCPTRHLS